MTAKTITVKSVSDDSRVLLWERDDAHPNGECFIANNGLPVVVGETPAITNLLATKKLQRVGKAKAPKDPEPTK